MASVHKFVRASRFAPVTLSSSGALASEAQPDINQTAASTLIMVFMDFSVRIRCEIPKSSALQVLVVALRVDCENWESCFKCDFRDGYAIHSNS